MSDTFRVEEVEAVTPPPRARVEDAIGQRVEDAIGQRVEDAVGRPVEDSAQAAPRTRDYLTGFLQQQPQTDAPGEPGGALYEAVIDALKEIYDPEIPVNIYDLGLIYGVEIGDGGQATVMMTLTTPHCPVAESMPAEVEMRVAAVPGIAFADVNLIWDPPWDPQKMSDEAKLELGML
jgi:FeS assembly SUF system protein